MNPPASVPSTTIRVLTGTCIWFTIALGVGGMGLLARLPMPGPQVVLLSLTLLLLLAFWKISSLRHWAMAVSPQVFLVPHFSRFVGIYFLILCDRGELPWAFAVPGGWGDIVTAALAIGVWFVPVNTKGGRTLWRIWNTFGLVDILFVVTTASRLGRADPASMHALVHLPLSLLLTFVVPIIIASHIVLFAKLRACEKG